MYWSVIIPGTITHVLYALYSIPMDKASHLTCLVYCLSIALRYTSKSPKRNQSTATCCDMRSIGDPESRPAVRSFDGEYGPGPSAGPSPSVGSSQQPAASSQQPAASSQQPAEQRKAQAAALPAHHCAALSEDILHRHAASHSASHPSISSDTRFMPFD